MYMFDEQVLLMYLFQTRNVTGHVYSCCFIDDPSRTCSWLTRNVTGHVYVVLLMYLFQTRNVTGHVYVCTSIKQHIHDPSRSSFGTVQ